MIFFRYLSLYIAIALFMSACDINSYVSKEPSSYINISNSNQPQYFAILGPISNGDVKFTLIDDNITVYATKTKTYNAKQSTLKWGSYDTGSFEVDINSSILSTKWLNIEVTKGVDIDSNDDGVVTNSLQPLNGHMHLYCRVNDLTQKSVVLNIFTTLGIEFYLAQESQSAKDKETFLNNFANVIFSRSIDENDGIDYRDIFAYIPNETPDRFLSSAGLYDRLLSNGIMNHILYDDDIVTILNEDKDLDGLNLWEELLHATSPLLVDSDGDTISDKDEIDQGLNPTRDDSDFDGIKDNDEQLYGTSPLLSDSDGDYIPDNIELKNNTNPLDADEDGNGILDGLDGDPFFKYQWYIKSLGTDVANTAHVLTTIGNDLNILDVYHKVLGNSSGEETVVQVIDTGVELIHKDLDIDLANSFNAITKAHDPTATFSVVRSDPTSPLDSGHGTAVSGIIAAKTNNGLGIRGIIPRGKIAGSNWLEDQTLGELERVWYSQVNDDKITVSNNSWGSYYLKDDGFERILALATSQLRGGKGRVYVFAAGNAREKYGNANLSYLSNNPYVITVAALNAYDKYAVYSNPGSNILVSAYGGDHYYDNPTIMTTSLSGKSYYENELNGEKGVITVNEDSSKDYTYAMNGTSAATPMVSASIALVIDACPSLSWRDIRWLIANSASQIDIKNDTWLKNAAGLHFSTDYGYGKINPSKMIDVCRSNTFSLLPKMKHTQAIHDYSGTIIPDNNTSVIKEIELKESLVVEWVGLTINTPHPFAGDLEINLTSPLGTKVNIIMPNDVTYAGYENGFRFSSMAFIDEQSNGVWKVEIIDRLDGDEGSLKSITLEVYGHD